MNAMRGSCTVRSRWTQPFVLWGLGTATSTIIAFLLLRYERPGFPIRSALEILPTVMWILFIVAIFRGIRKLDEMGQRIHLQVASIAFLLTIILTYASVGLDAAGIRTLTASDIAGAAPLIWVFTLVFVTRRYQ